MGSCDAPEPALKAPAFDRGFDRQVAARLRTAFAKSRHAALIADDQRRWVAGNAAACDLLGIAQEAVSWHTMDDFTPLSERARLQKQWAEFLCSGQAEGRYQLYVPNHEPFPVEFGVIANVLAARHLVLLIPPDEDDARQQWGRFKPSATGRLPLTKREREVMTLAARGGRSDDMAEQLRLSPETIRSHVANAMSKLGAHTRAHAVAIALVTGEILWSDDAPLP
jgi:DNA-binding CsgD family transcriptional regulator